MDLFYINFEFPSCSLGKRSVSQSFRIFFPHFSLKPQPLAQAHTQISEKHRATQKYTQGFQHTSLFPSTALTETSNLNICTLRPGWRQPEQWLPCSPARNPAGLCQHTGALVLEMLSSLGWCSVSLHACCAGQAALQRLCSLCLQHKGTGELWWDTAPLGKLFPEGTGERNRANNSLLRSISAPELPHSQTPHHTSLWCWPHPAGLCQECRVTEPLCWE